MTKDGEVSKLKGKKERLEKAEVVSRSIVVGSEGKKKKKKQKGELEQGSGAVMRKNKDGIVLSKKKRRREEDVANVFGDDTSGVVPSTTDDQIVDGPDHVDGASDTSRKNKKKKKKNRNLTSSNQGQELTHEGKEAVEDDVLYMSSGDEDSSTGMKKWLTEYHDQRPGFEILQQRIDDFIVAHEEKLEQERKEREARIAEDGWTVVEHHKGRKKTTDTESGIAVGSVAQAAVLDKMSKKKQKGVGLDFYRFQKREAQRDKIIMLQSKFEEDKKRIQQLRAARKFRPY